MILAIIGLFIPASAVFGLAILAVIDGRLRGVRLVAGTAAGAAILIPAATWHVAAIAGTVIVGLVVVVIAIRFVLAPADVKRHYPAALWARLRWRWLMRNLGLGWRDRHVQDKIRRTAFMPVTRHLPAVDKNPGRHLVRYPRARIKADAYGIVAKVRTIPGSGRAEFDQAAQHIADAWRCHRVHVSQTGPGRLVVRGLRTDPLAEPTGVADAPSGLFGSESPPGSLYLGRDQVGGHRFLPLPGITGITVSGLPGLGKSSLVSSWLCQLAGTPAVQFAIADGKGGGDYQPWKERAWRYGEELPEVLALLEDAHAEMQHRLGSVLERTGHRNAWHAPLTEAMPLLVVVIDECQSYLDVASLTRVMRRLRRWPGDASR